MTCCGRNAGVERAATFKWAVSPVPRVHSPNVRGRGDDSPLAICEIERHGVEVIDQIETSDDSWDEYLARTKEAVLRCCEDHPGEWADQYVKEQHEWQSDHQRDRPILTWSVWVGQKRSRTVCSTT